MAAFVASSLEHLPLPKQIGGQCCNSGGIPTRPPPKSGAKPQGGWAGETNLELAHLQPGGAGTKRGGWVGMLARPAHLRPRCMGTIRKDL